MPPVRSLILSTVLALLLPSSSVLAATQPFPKWLEALRVEAKKKGISEKGLVALEGIEPIPRVIELDRKQPEARFTFEQYLEKVVRADRIEEGRRLRGEHAALLDQVAAKHGVDPEFIVALWGVETSFGRITGDYSVVAALATLAYDGRRSQMFRAQLLDALKILDQGHITPEAMKGSWAGAMGQCQFMPGTFLAYAFDQNGDGRKDIWGTLDDVFGSAANYLRRIGWKRGTGWGAEVTLPANLDPKLIGISTQKTAEEWSALGIKPIDGAKLSSTASLSLVRPGGKSERLFLVHGNYRALLKWNRSEYFATAVSLLATAIAEAPPVPAESMKPDVSAKTDAPSKSAAPTKP